MHDSLKIDSLAPSEACLESTPLEYGCAQARRVYTRCTRTETTVYILCHTPHDVVPPKIFAETLKSRVSPDSRSPMQSLARRCLSWRACSSSRLISPSFSPSSAHVLGDAPHPLSKGHSQPRRTFFSRWPSRRPPRHVKKPLEPSEVRTKQAKAAGATVTALVLVGGAGWVAYEKYQPFRHTALAAVRCSRIAGEFQTVVPDYSGAERSCNGLNELTIVTERRGCGVGCY